jgi:hypothetical protein
MKEKNRFQYCHEFRIGELKSFSVSLKYDQINSLENILKTKDRQTKKEKIDLNFFLIIIIKDIFVELT